jgi:hypothetical protein
MAERITFDRSLYLAEAVEAAAAAYAEHANIEVTPAADAVVAEIAAGDPNDQQTVTNAFCNHVLHETITRRRHAALDEVA